MANTAFDSNLQLLGNNIAKCHQLIDEALKVSAREPNENSCQHRVRRLCTSQPENKRGRSVPNSTAVPKSIPSKTCTSVGHKSTTDIRTRYDKGGRTSVTSDRRPSNQASLNSGTSKNLENYKIFAGTRVVSGNKNNPPRLPKARCPPAGSVRSKSVKTRVPEKPKPWSNILREQNRGRKNSESDTDLNQCMLCDKPERDTGPTFSELSGKIKTLAESMQVMNQDRFRAQSGEKGGSTFSIFNPVRTLHFLLEELEGKIYMLSDNDVKRILVEMEETLQRIPTNLKNFSMSATDNVHSVPCEVEPPQKLSKFTSAVEETQKRLSECGERPSNENLQLKLELSCSKLEKACQEMEKACSELKKERDYFKTELQIKKKAYEELLKKESGYIATINDLKQNLVNMTAKADEHTRSIENLNVVLNQLQEENKVVSALKDLHKKLNTRVRETNQENEQIKSELQISNLEREKLALLLASRDEELKKLKRDFGEVQEFVADQLVNTSMKKDAVPSNVNLSVISVESVQQKPPNPTPESNNLTSKSSTCYRNSVPSGWHVMNSDLINSTALKSGNRTSSTDQKKNLTANNLIDSIRMLITEMKQDPVTEIKQSEQNFDVIEKYSVPHLSDVSMASQHSEHDISQISSLSGLTL
nr:PREDICTED: uncharacterized protein LOC109036748 [Bemisia tabaci]